MQYPKQYGTYTLLERLGQGGMSAVDLARQTVADADYVRLLVIKRLRPEIAVQPQCVRMFQDEARINTELQHPNIVHVYNFGHFGDEYYLAMEYIAGTDLRSMQKEMLVHQRSIPLRITLRVLADVLRALDYAHRRVDTFGRSMNVVHRDVNPRNIMLSVRGDVKLIDFGVAKADTRTEHTVSHTLKGKFAYMSPEQIEGNQPIDARSDLFAVGLILNELINQRSPFAGLGDVQTMHRILSGKIPPLAPPNAMDVHEALHDIHQKALAQDPAERFSSAQEMLAAIVGFANDTGGLASPAELTEWVLRFMPDVDRSRLDRLRDYRDATPPTPSQPEHTAEPTIVDFPVEGPTQPTIPQQTPPSVMAEARSASRPILIGLGVGLAILMVVMGSIWLADRMLLPESTSLSSPEPVEATPDPVPDTPSLLPSTEPPPDPIPAPEVNAAPPDTVTSPSTAQPRQTRPQQRTLQPQPEAEPSPVTTEPQPVETGYLFVTSSPSKGHPVFVDGQRVGVTPLNRHTLSVGTHRVVVRHEQTNDSRQQTVSVEVGRSERVTVIW